MAYLIEKDQIENATSQRLWGRFSMTNGPLEEISIGAGLSLNANTGVLTAADNSIEVYIDFQTLTAFIYTCPSAMKFTSQTSQGTPATLSVALNTNMAQFAQFTVTPTVIGLVILKGVTL